jgi:hypothetical protein
METSPNRCPLCLATEKSRHFYTDKQRQYYRCNKCHLIHVPPSYHLSFKAERTEYDKHQNSPDDTGYRSFLDRLFSPLNSKLSPASYGLDFGCGPGPTLSEMFKEAGHQIEVFDPHYAPDAQVLIDLYDFITASEVVEHLQDPSTELNLLWSIIKPGGWLGIMTKLALDKTAFSTWHYKNDPTHICFFSRETMDWLANQWHTATLQIGKDVVLFKKPGKNLPT